MKEDQLLKLAAEAKGSSIANQGMIEILISFICIKHGNKEFFDFLRTIIDSGKFSDDAENAAKTLLDLEDSFGERLFPLGQTVQ